MSEEKTPNGWILVIALFLALLIGGIVSWSWRGKIEKGKDIKEAIKTTKSEIKKINEAKTVDAVNTSSESRTLVKKAENTVKRVQVIPPRIKDTTLEAKKQYIKRFEP